MVTYMISFPCKNICYVFYTILTGRMIYFSIEALFI